MKKMLGTQAEKLIPQLICTNICVGEKISDLLRHRFRTKVEIVEDAEIRSQRAACRSCLDLAIGWSGKRLRWGAGP